MRLRAPIAVLAIAVAVVAASGTRASNPAAASDLTAAEAIAIVRQIVDEGLDCAYPGSGLTAVGYTAKPKAGDAFTVTAKLSGKDAAGRVVAFGIDFDVYSATDVRAPNAAAEKILACSGPPATASCASKKTGLQSKPLGGKPYARYGPVTVYRRVPGLKVVRRGSAWILSGVRVARAGDLWTMDDCTGQGRVETGSRLALSGGKQVATVGARVRGLETTGCPSAPLPVVGKILSGDPRIAIGGRPIAVPASKILYAPSCGSDRGHVG